MVLQQAKDPYVELWGGSFDWLVGLIFLLGWIEVEAASH
jgi:hypothetical protein